MNKEKILALHQQHRDGDSKYVYFLLAVAASAIAFSAQKPMGNGFAWQQLPLGIAVLCWALSFYFGCRLIKSTQIALAANLNYLKTYDAPNSFANDQEYQAELDFHFGDANKNGGIARDTGKYQFKFLVAGFCFFLVWHLLGMYLAK